MLFHLYTHTSGSSLNNSLGSFNTVGIQVLGLKLGNFTELLSGEGTGFLMARLKRLQSSGTLDMNTAVGVEGKVYLRIPPDGIGKVEIPLQGGMNIFDARSDGKKTIQSGERVKVVAIAAGNVMVVSKA